jgi:mono/diheme cytochrome c family protein
MNGVTPVDEAAPRTALAFPFNLRASMAGWNLLFLDRRRFEPDPDKSQELNRGAYLVNALGHCGACHTPRNFLMAEKTDKALSGAMVGPWYAPNITSDEVSGIGAWRTDELIQYLRTGHARGKNQAAGGMAEAVQNSLQYLPAADLAAIAAYLKSTVPIRDPGDSQAAHAWGQPASDEAARRGSAPPNSTRPLVSGADLYSGYCASCHQADGAGSANQAYPALFNNTATGSTRPANLVAAILYGVDRSTRDGGHVVMPRFDSLSYVDPLTDEQIAAIANHVLIRYGNSAARVSDTDVAIARRGGPRPLLAQAQPFMAPALGVLLLLGVFSAVQWWRRTR